MDQTPSSFVAVVFSLTALIAKPLGLVAIIGALYLAPLAAGALLTGLCLALISALIIA